MKARIENSPVICTDDGWILSAPQPFLLKGEGGWSLRGHTGCSVVEQWSREVNPETGQIKVTVDGKSVRTVPAEFISVPFGRSAPIGMADDGAFYTGFATAGPGLESVLLASTDGGQSWSENWLDGGSFSTTSLSGTCCILLQLAERIPISCFFGFWQIGLRSREA